MRSRVLLVLLPLLVVFAGAELYLRWRADVAREVLRATIGERELCTERSPDRRLIYTYRPGTCGANSRGFRDREHTTEKPARTYRIVLIGDSVAEGRDLAADSTFGSILEREMNADSTGWSYEVILLARIGYSTEQELVLLEEEAFRYQPDLILWSYCLNDPADPVFHNANGALGAYYHRPRSQVWELFRAGSFRVRQAMAARKCPREFHAFLHCAFADQVRSDIKRIAKVAGEYRTPVILLVHPVFENKPSFEDYSLSEVHTSLVETARANGMQAIDVLEAFRFHTPASLKLDNPDYFDPWHMNASGHRVTADFVHQHLAVTGVGP